MQELNADQIAYWNGEAGQRWTERQERQDALLAPISRLVLERAAAASGEHVIDIGCGCGQTTLELTGQVGSTGKVLGIDVSAPMLARARHRVRNGAEFIEADATDFPFERENTDLLFSRFGVMFFARPEVSFANMRTALRPGGRLVFVCWREPRANPWFMVPLQAAYQHVPRLPEMAPDDPGPFSFAKEERVRRILDEAGFTSIEMTPYDFPLDLACGGGLEAAVEAAVSIGPASRAIDGQPAELKAAAANAIRESLAQFLDGAMVPLTAAVWFVTAKNC